MNNKISAVSNSSSSIKQEVSRALQISGAKAEIKQRLQSESLLQENNKIHKGLKRATVENIVNNMNNNSLLSQKIMFSYSDKLGELYVKIIDVETNQVIGQIPAKSLLRLEANMREIAGLIVDKTQ